MGRNRPRERFLLSCLLVAIIAGTVALKAWVVSVEQRLADNLEIHRAGADIDHSQTSVVESHERRLRSVERATWSLWDRRLVCK